MATQYYPYDGNCYLEQRQSDIEAEREAGEWQDHWDAIRKGECDDPDAAGAMRAPGYEDWED
jgi:hypothetical protein